MTVVDSVPPASSCGPLDPFDGPPRPLLDQRGAAGVADLGAGRGPDWLDQWLGRHTADLIGWRRHLHAHPELGNAEHATTRFVADRLAEVGLNPKLLPAGTGLVCDIGMGERCVALRADLDALPMAEATGHPFSSTVDGVAHACGHDAHIAILLGVANALAAGPVLPGRVRLIFQPAEEVLPGGSPDVISAGGLDDVDQIFALHCDPRLPVGRIGTRVGPITSAYDALELRLSSPGGHTSRPHLTADLVHAIGTVITGLPLLLSRRIDPRSGTVLVWGAVHAGQAVNAVPRDGMLRGTLRTGDRTTWNELGTLVPDLVDSLLSPTGVSFEFDHQRGVPPVVNDEEATQLLRSAVTAALGAGTLAEAGHSSGGDDFGWYVEQVPGSYARLGVWPGHGPQHDLHQPSFDLDERALPVGVRVMVHTALAALS